MKLSELNPYVRFASVLGTAKRHFGYLPFPKYDETQEDYYSNTFGVSDPVIVSFEYRTKFARNGRFARFSVGYTENMSL